MSDIDITLWIELRSEYVDTEGVKRHVGVEVVADYIQLADEQIIATHHSSPVFTSDRSDVIGIRIIGQTQSSPPRFTDREGQPWTTEEDHALHELSTAGASTGRMAYELGRQSIEVPKRTSQLGLPLPRR
jgi:hypothetical protein